MKKPASRRSLILSVALFTTVTLSACSSSSSDPSDEGNEGDGGGENSFRLARIDVDAGNDGVFDEQYSIVYDAQGLATSELLDFDRDGVVDTEVAFTYQDGNLFRVTEDDGRDGTIDKFRSFSYDSNGVLIAQTITEALNGPVTGSGEYLQNTSGQLTGVNVDTDGNGTIDEVGTYTFNSAGTVERIEFDVDFDNAAEILISFTYGEVGEVLTRTRQLADSTITSVWTYVYEEGPCDPRSERQPKIETCVTGLVLPVTN